MSYYFLIASLPALQIGDDPPFTTEEYIERCAGTLSKREMHILNHVLHCETVCESNGLANKWFALETQLRNAVAKLRASKYGVDAKEYLRPHPGCSGLVESIVTDAFTRDDPLEVEQELDRGRWLLADQLIGENPFGFGNVLAYGIKLRIVQRWANMDVHEGKKKLEAVITANTEKRDQEEQPEESA